MKKHFKISKKYKVPQNNKYQTKTTRHKHKEIKRSWNKKS